MREPGFYWVKTKPPGDSIGWFPAVWTTEKPETKYQWFCPGVSNGVADAAFSEIGPRLYPPAEGHGTP